MSALDRFQNVLRDIHILVGRSRAYGKDQVIVNKEELFAMIDSLNASVYELTEEYELTASSRQKALLDQQQQADKIVWDATKKAEDIYAASIMYTDETLGRMQTLINESLDLMKKSQEVMIEQFDQDRKTMSKNQLELKSQLQELMDSGTYMSLIEERNRQIAKEKELENNTPPEESQFANVKTEIKINRAFFQEHGYATPELDEDEEKKEAGSEESKDSEEKATTAALDDVEIDIDLSKFDQYKYDPSLDDISDEELAAAEAIDAAKEDEQDNKGN